MHPSAAISLPAPSVDMNGASAHTLGEIEQQAIEKALEKYHGNRKLAAQALGISERTLYRKLPKEQQAGDQVEA